MKDRKLENTAEQLNASDIFSDMRTSQSLIAVLNSADELIRNSEGDINNLLRLEEKISGHPDKYNPLTQLTLKAAISKIRIMSLTKPLHLELVVPLYHETIRMAPRQGSTTPLLDNPLPPHKHGENALIRKYLEMEWLTKDSQISYRLILVDDICDHNSGGYAEKIIAANNLEKCEVHYLADAVKNTEPGSFKHKAIETIIAGGNSIRGGALCLGFAESVRHIKAYGLENNAVIGYVDADSSYSLTQIGIPLWKIHLSDSTHAVTASRQHPLSYMEPAKTESQTSQRSSGLIRLKQVVGYLRQYVLGEEVPTDTQSGFKLFKPDLLEQTLKEPNKAHNFSYDTQLLARISRMHPNKKPIDTFGVVCLDCDELSTANNGVTYFYALEIINSIADEFKFDKNGEQMWLLDFLTRDIKNYHLAKRVLDDNTDIKEWFNPTSPEFNLIKELREEIKTDKDTTAVGDYFNEIIFHKLVRVFREIDEKSTTIIQ